MKTINIQSHNCIDQLTAAIETSGTEAYHFGADAEDNPYDHKTPEHELWFTGWAFAADRDPAQRR